ncbi:peroxiredoxin family protein [Alistipes sp. ZOR0009]|uniref:peroxiredoxin family protein n=1 Tax=Alistipes sp. ZOR0009 TaxID=1339253 RepID=UPI000A664D99|nr:TlpA disulfide reductase family protein [Alistipes sp. ZOR0009]
MRKTIGRAAIVLVLLCSSVLVYKIVVKVNQKKECERITQALPSYTFNLAYGGTMHTKSLEDKPTAVMFFNPGCEHCEYEGEALSTNSGSLKEKEILMVSLSPRDSIKAYAKRHRLEGISNIRFATDSLAKATIMFGVQAIPTTFIYGSDGRLRKRFNGEVSIKALMRELR